MRRHHGGAGPHKEYGRCTRSRVCPAILVKHLFLSLFLALLVALSGCVHRQTDKTPGAQGSGSHLLVVQGTILHKSSRLQTITLAPMDGDKEDSTIISFDFRTRGMEYVGRGKKVKITCKKLTKGNKPCKALTIVPMAAALPEGVTGMTARELKKKIDAHRDITLVDTRPASDYARCHIPGAFSLPACGQDAATRLRQLDHDTTLVLYCGWKGCSQSLRLARLALAEKTTPFDNITILQKGLDGWIDEGLVTVAEDRFVLSGKLVLLDLRPARKNTVQRIPGAVSLPLPLLEKRINELPHAAPIVLYGDSLEQSMKGLRLLRENGFTRAAMVAGDFHGWKKRHNPVTSGPIITEIRWQQPLRPGEIAAPMLKKQMQQRAGILLDVRSDTERRRQGSLKGSIAIPLARLYQKMDTLNRKKTIYCVCGAQAELAREILNDNGFTARYLSADGLVCDGKTCNIRE